MGKVNFGLTVSLDEAQSNVIAENAPGQAGVAEKLSAVAAGLLADLAKGGVMIPPDWAIRIRNAIGTVEPAAIIENVEKAVGRCGESVRIEWVPDPTWLGFLQAQADNTGITLSHQLQAHLDHALCQGWLGGSAPDPFKLLLDRDQYRELQQFFEKDVVTGTDVVDCVRRNEGTAFVQAADDDTELIMDSLSSKG